MFNFFKKKTLPRLSQFTDSGMLCLFNYANFTHVVDYDSWDKELCEDKDIIRHIEQGEFVPISFGDGAFDVIIRINEEAVLSEREKKYLVVQSKPYKLISTGKVCLSPLETVGKEISDRLYQFSLPSGTYKVIVNMIEWGEEPGALDEKGRPTPAALPDFIIFIEKITNSQNENFSTSVETFERPN
ncbi:MAG: hypothetical protein JXR63_09345 [Spirochaetales bacterium]|nr:hypothetical protein [Spirochaetales bacterium]